MIRIYKLRQIKNKLTDKRWNVADAASNGVGPAKTIRKYD